MASDPQGFVSVRTVRAVRLSPDLSLLCELSNGDRVFIPEDAIAPDSQVWRPGDFGTLVLRRDIAARLRLV